MNHWLETSKQNLLPLSKATLFTEALSEWQFTGNVYDYDGKDIECELCEHPDLYHHYEIRNKLNENRLLVGSSCILKFSEINVKDEMGNLITEKEKRKEILYDSLKKKLIESTVDGYPITGQHPMIVNIRRFLVSSGIADHAPTRNLLGQYF